MLVLIPSLFIDSRVRDPCLSDPQLHLPLLVLQPFSIETVRIEADERIEIQSVGFRFGKALTDYLDFRTSGMTCRSSIPFVDFQDDPGTIVLGFYDGSRALAGMGS